ncbi:MAG: lipase family protein [Pseudolabrys sp.]
MSAFVNIPASDYPPDAFDRFDPNRADIDLGNARALMWFSQLAYETAASATLQNAKDIWKFKSLRPLIDNKVSVTGSFDTRGVVAEHGDATIVTFAGTDPFVWQNLFTDFTFGKTPRGTHEGFQSALDHIWDQLFAVIKDSKRPLVFTGHSLGGALAVLAAERAFDESAKPGGDATLKPALVYVYGMPRTGSPEWAAAYNQKLGDKTFRFVHGSDIVSRVPRLNFHHVGRVLDCGMAEKFSLVPPAAPLSALGSNDPTLGSGVISAAMKQVLIFAAGHLFAAAGPGVLGFTFRFLPPPIRDHLQDQYYNALAP